MGRRAISTTSRGPLQSLLAVAQRGHLSLRLVGHPNPPASPSQTENHVPNGEVQWVNSRFQIRSECGIFFSAADALPFSQAFSLFAKVRVISQNYGLARWATIALQIFQV